MTTPDDESRPLDAGRGGDSWFTRFLLKFVGPASVSPMSEDDLRALEQVRREAERRNGQSD